MPPHIDGTQKMLMLPVAGFFDALQLAFAWTLIGQNIIAFFAFLTFFTWFLIRGVRFRGWKRIAKFFLPLAGEMVLPFFNLAPWILIGVMWTIHDVNSHYKKTMKKLGGTREKEVPA